MPGSRNRGKKTTAKRKRAANKQKTAGSRAGKQWELSRRGVRGGDAWNTYRNPRPGSSRGYTSRRSTADQRMKARQNGAAVKEV